MQTSPVPVPTRRSFLAAAGASGLLAVLAACTSGDPNAPESSGASQSAAGSARKRGGTIKVGIPAPPTAVDPVTMYDGSAIIIVQLVADYLIWLDSDLKLVPRLATKWTAEQGGKRWAFTLRSGVSFSDGTPLTAQAVKASFDRLLDPKNKSAALSAFDGILASGGVTIRDSRTVVFTLQRTFSDFPYLVSAGNYNAVILKADYAGDFAKKPIGTGPFLLGSYSTSGGATLTRNPKYWQSGKPYLDGVQIHFYADSQAQTLALQGGAVDVLGLTQINDVPTGGNIAIDKTPGTGITTFTLRTDKAPFDKKEVRQAVAYALDRPAINTATNDGIGQLGNDHLLAPLFPAAPKDIAQRAKNVAKARSLLSTAGVDKLAFTLTYDPPSKDFALAVQDQLKDAGITVTLDQQSSQAFYGGNQTKDTPWLFSTANLVGWAGRAVPSQFVAPMVTSKGVWNGSKYANPKLDAALVAYDAAATAAERAAQAEIIASAMHEDVPVIIAVWNGAARAYDRTTFVGVRAHPESFLDLTDVSRV